MVNEKLNTTGYFIGKEFIKNGLQKDGKTEYSLYKLKFKPFIDSEKSFSFSAFKNNSVQGTLQIEDLKDAARYNISYTERDHVLADGKAVKPKTIFCIKDYAEESNMPIPKPIQTQLPGKSVEILAQDKICEINQLTNFHDFAAKYLLQCPEEKRSVNHLVGTYLGSYYKETFKRLFDQSAIIIESSKINKAE